MAMLTLDEMVALLNRVQLTPDPRIMCGPPLKLCGSSRILEGANQNKSPTEIRDVHYIQKFAGAKWG